MDLIPESVVWSFFTGRLPVQNPSLAERFILGESCSVRLTSVKQQQLLRDDMQTLTQETAVCFSLQTAIAPQP